MMEIFRCAISGIQIIHHDRRGVQEYTDSIDYSALKKQLGAEGAVMKTVADLAQRTASSSGYNATTVIWVDVAWRDDVCTAYVRVDVAPGANDTADAIGDRLKLTAQTSGAKLKTVVDVLNKSRELAELARPHEFTSDPARQGDPSVVYHPDKDVVRAAKKLSKIKQKQNLEIKVDDGSTVTLEPPHRGGACVVATTRTVTETVEITSLTRPNEGKQVSMRQCGGKRTRIHAYYEMEQYHRLYTAMAIDAEQRLKVQLCPITDLIDNNATLGAYRLVSVELVVSSLAFSDL